ncbi:SPOR domain-containing protein [Aurantiacibacter marinus]|uniref:SPOR domain-containing protein n=1 Tax=Aurantiacibacter marinus TaxID=874156 RepID=UPI00138E4C00|nr:SPOR domain-containing protein [Aurantiacibacter marinus]
MLKRGVLTVFLTAGLSACGTLGGGGSDSGLASAGDQSATAMRGSNGPRADYPVLVGEPYRVAGVEYIPSDTLNYDHVGYVAVDLGAVGYSGAHHTLPFPSYVEVTSLETGRTVLVRLERRGPMTSNHLLALSPAALAQLGATAETPVRVRRVNPPETERFVLRGGEPASLRMDTPQSLLTVLQRRLPADGGASLRAENAATPAALSAVPESSIETVALAASDAMPTPRIPDSAPPAPIETARAELPPVPGTPLTLPPLDASPGDANPGDSLGEMAQASIAPIVEPATAPAIAAEGNFVVQAAAFSTIERAERVANVLGGQITQSGRYYRVRTGPFLTRGEAEASLANVRRAGYSDARILTSG